MNDAHFSFPAEVGVYNVRMDLGTHPMHGGAATSTAGGGVSAPLHYEFIGTATVSEDSDDTNYDPDDAEISSRRYGGHQECCCRFYFF